VTESFVPVLFVGLVGRTEVRPGGSSTLSFSTRNFEFTLPTRISYPESIGSETWWKPSP